MSLSVEPKLTKLTLLLKFILILTPSGNHIINMKHIPNFITSLNLASGFAAIIFTLNNDLVTASWLILAAMIFDFLDGFFSRLLDSYSDIGKELDSLSDLVSFGVAPALIIFNLLNASLSLSAPTIINEGGLVTFIILGSTVIMPVCAAFRLAIFNTDETQAKSFKGLPTPANALAVISVVIARNYSDPGFLTSFTDSPAGLVIFTLALSLLMVSRIPLLSLKISDFRFRGNEGRYVLIIFAGAALLISGLNAAPLIIPIYILASLVSLLFR
jgi:CDP-diacylglycerol--serine O-phosphatidyltransferase